ncbi:MAG: KH domain-containing protein [Candidatus Heimdallarchaeota archaeon]
MQIKIPKERIGVVIGRNGAIKERIETETKTRLQIDSASGEVVVENQENTDDPTGVWVATNIIKAIGRGFNPWKALRLLDDEIYLEMIDLTGFVGTSKKTLQRIRGRLIGKDGKTRTIIEQSTDTYISIYGKTISIIGFLNEIKVAREAIYMLLEGTSHGTVYRYLQEQKRQLKLAQLDQWKPI